MAHGDTIKIPECQNVNPPDMWHASLKSHILPRNHERRHGEMFEMQRHYFRALSEDSRRLVEKHSANGKSEAPTDKKQALACVFPLWFWYISVPQVLLAALGGWNAGLSACSVVLLVFLVVHFLNEGRQRRLNVVLTARKDEEASEPELPHVELQTFSEFGRDVSLGYAMNLKQRFGRRHRGAGKL
ncbi:MAG: hypothetical protein LQ348_001203 [Seirophora lacunosa]|nr:MAG: hypothetical protein LQ348_001203 [Seirophora lacunosa]